MAAARLGELLGGGAAASQAVAGSAAPGRRRSRRSGGPPSARARAHGAATGRMRRPGRGNLVRQAVTLLVHFPSSAARS